MQGCLGRPCLGVPPRSAVVGLPSGVDGSSRLLPGGSRAGCQSLHAGEVPVFRTPCSCSPGGSALNAAGVPGPESVYLVQGVILQPSTGWGAHGASPATKRM